jgi:hypothetical protein
MAAEYFNSLGGFSAGLPEVPVIDANGNVVTNVLTNGNVFANVVYATYYRYANGQPFSGGGNGTPGGTNTQLQFNNNGSFAGIPNVTWNGNILSLGNVSALSIGGGVDGYFLQTDGAGNLTWAAGGSGGNGTPGGSNTQVQFNDAGIFGGDVDFTYNKTTNILTVGNIVAGNVNATHSGSGAGLTNIPGANVTGTVANAAYAANAGSATTATTATSAISAGSAISALTAGTVTTGAQPNITSVGTLTSLAVSGNITAANVNGGNLVTANFFSGDGGLLTNITANGSTYSNSNVAAYLPTYTGNVGAGNVNVTGTVFTNGISSTGLASLTNLNVSTAANLGAASNIKITGGTDGYFLQTDGTGNLTWAAGGSGGNGSPGGNNTQIQYNDNGVFGGSQFLTFNDATNTVQVAGNLLANTMQLGAGIYKFCTTEVYFATTASTSPNQLLYSIPTEGISGADFHIIATDAVGATRQSSKISSVVYGNTVQYSEYAGMYINGGIGSFSVSYNPGNVVTEPSLELKISPDSLNQTVYKMLITVFDD